MLNLNMLITQALKKHRSKSRTNSISVLLMIFKIKLTVSEIPANLQNEKVLPFLKDYFWYTYMRHDIQKWAK